MSNSLVDMFRIKELKKKVLLTFLLLAVTRIGTVIPIPGIDSVVLRQYFLEQTSSSTVGITEYLNFFSGGAFSKFSLFMLGVMPYISAQIILQLLMLIVPSLKRLSREPSGRRKIQRYTNYGTILVCLIESFVVTIYAKSIPNVLTISMGLFTLVAMVSVTAGSMLLVWLGEIITKVGVGNGISLLIMAGIVARMPNSIGTMFTGIQSGEYNSVHLVMLFIMAIALIVLVVYEETGMRKIPVDYAKRVVGRKMYGAQSTYIPFKINPSNVIPVIFASAILSFPLQIAQMLGPEIRWLNTFANWLRPQGAPYLIIYTTFIIAFAFFYSQVSLNPADIAKNIRENGGSVRGVRPGRDSSGRDYTEIYLTKVINRIVFPGALFLAIIALIPSLITILFNYPTVVSMMFGGTSLIIVVGVALETVKQIEAEMKTHHVDGYLTVSGKKRRSNNL